MLVNLALVHDLLQEIGSLLLDVVQIVTDVVGIKNKTLCLASLGVSVPYRLCVDIDFPYGSTVYFLFALKNHKITSSFL